VVNSQAQKIPLLEHLSAVPDPRALNRKYSLASILALAIVAVVCDCDTWEDIADYAAEKRDWFVEFLDLPTTMPSADTFSRVFSLLSPDALATGFSEWTKSMAPCIPQWTHFDVVAIDGKTMRGTKWRGGPAAHMVSAWSSANGICMASIATDTKSNEITAIPKLLELLELSGAFVTIDAMGCQRDIATAIVSKGAQYILALKDNQKTLSDDVQLMFWEERQRATNAVPGKLPVIECTHHITEGKDHGRFERRVASVITDDSALQYLHQQHQWPHLAAIGKVTSTRKTPGGDSATETADRFYLLSRPLAAEQLNVMVRAHWGVENSLHYVMDVTFADDKGHAVRAAENLHRIRQMALNLLKLAPLPKPTALRRKRKRANWNPRYLQEVLAGPGPDLSLEL
jgi:predicted transposase YbfD/YdcC